MLHGTWPSSANKRAVERKREREGEKRTEQRRGGARRVRRRRRGCQVVFTYRLRAPRRAVGLRGEFNPMRIRSRRGLRIVFAAPPFARHAVHTVRYRSPRDSGLTLHKGSTSQKVCCALKRVPRFVRRSVRRRSCHEAGRGNRLKSPYLASLKDEEGGKT